MTTFDVHDAQLASGARKEVDRVVGEKARSVNSPKHKMAVILDALYHHAQDERFGNETLWAADVYQELTGRRPGWIEAAGRGE